MSLVTGIISLLTVSSASLALDFSRFLWTTKPSTTMEEIQTIEMIKWRQPVCLIPAEGVYPCLHEMKKFQQDYEQSTGKEPDLMSSGLIKSKTSLMSKDEQTVISTPPFSEELVTEKSSEHRPITLELTEDEEKSIVESRHFSSFGQKKNSQQIYVTKVLRSPMTATLVAYGCVPDIGVPLCPNYPAGTQPTRPTFDSKPALTFPADDKPVKISTGSPNGNPHQSFDTVIKKPSRPQVIIRHPSNEELSTSFGLEGAKMAAEASHDDYPSKLGVKDQSAKVELSMDPGNETLKTSEVSARNEHRIFQTIRDIVNKTEKSKIVQSIRNILRRPAGQKMKDSSGIDAVESMTEPKKTMDNYESTSSADGLHRSLMDGSKPGTKSDETIGSLDSASDHPVGSTGDGKVEEVMIDGS